MTLELVRATTSDGLRLDGSWRVPPSTGARPTNIEALLLLHGVGGTFYGGQMFQALAPPLLDLGVAVLRVNTRGHGAVSLIPADGGSRYGGAAFETVAECVKDIAAWTGWLSDRGYSRIGLLGHSLGAIKALYAAAHRLAPSVQCLLAVSPPRLSYDAFSKGPQRDLFLQALSTARRHLAEGNPQALFRSRFPFPLLISAASFVDKYGPEERYNFLKFVGRIPLPLLLVYGQLELEQGSAAFAGLTEEIAQSPDPSARRAVSVIPGADHFYSGKYDQLADSICQWLVQAAPRL